MNSFTVHLQGTTEYKRLDNIESFVGKDDSGSFGVMAHHARMITCLNFGLAQAKEAGGNQWYLALPGGVLYFVEDELYISTRMFSLSNDENKILEVLNGRFLEEEHHLESIKRSLHQLDEEMTMRLWKLTKKRNR